MTWRCASPGPPALGPGLSLTLIWKVGAVGDDDGGATLQSKLESMPGGGLQQPAQQYGSTRSGLGTTPSRARAHTRQSLPATPTRLRQYTLPSYGRHRREHSRRDR